MGVATAQLRRTRGSLNSTASTPTPPPPPPVVAGTTYADPFTRTDGALGSDWISTSVPPTIVGGQVVASAGQNTNRWNLDADPGTMFSELTYLGGQAVGPAVAIPAFPSGSGANSSAVGSYYILRTTVGAPGPATIRQKDVGAGTTVQLLDTGVTMVAGDVMRLEYDGTTLTAKRNGTTIGTMSPTSPLTDRGIGFAHHVASQVGTPIVDSWAGGVVTGSTTTPTTPSTLPALVTPDLTAWQLNEGTGVCTQLRVAGGVYDADNMAHYLDECVALGVTYVRSRFSESLAQCRDAIPLLRERGLKWGMLCLGEGSDKPTDDTDADVKATVDYIAAHAWDVCFYLEGLNEPNHNRGTGTTTTGWETIAAARQHAIKLARDDTTSRTVAGAYGGDTFRNVDRLGDVYLISCSLHDAFAAKNNGQHYKDLATKTNIEADIDYFGMHRYQNGGDPLNKLETRLSWISAAFPGKPVIATEAGWHNALATTGGHLAGSEHAAEFYVVRLLMEMFSRGMVGVDYYELLDDQDAGVTTVEKTDARTASAYLGTAWPVGTKRYQEYNFGLIAVPAGSGGEFNTAAWRRKPAFAALSAFMAAITEPNHSSGSYAKQRVRVAVDLQGHDEVRTEIIGFRDGSAVLVAYRDVPVWTPPEYDSTTGTWANVDPANPTGRDVTPASVNITVTDVVAGVKADRTMAVGGKASWLTIRNT